MRGSTVVRLGAYILVTVGLFALVRASVTSGTGPRPEETAELGRLADPGETYDPVRAGEALPAGFRQLLRRDAILPIYDPVFLPTFQSDWADDTLVIGLALDGEAKAYPVRFLNRREMVVDSIAGIPVLVTW
jgi:hypothetical protein